MKKFNATTKKWLDIIITIFVILFISFIIIKVIPKEITGGNYVEAKIESISKNKISVFIEDTHGNVFNVKKGDSISIPIEDITNFNSSKYESLEKDTNLSINIWLQNSKQKYEIYLKTPPKGNTE